MVALKRVNAGLRAAILNGHRWQLSNDRVISLSCFGVLCGAVREDPSNDSLFNVAKDRDLMERTNFFVVDFRVLRLPLNRGLFNDRQRNAVMFYFYPFVGGTNALR